MSANKAMSPTCPTPDGFISLYSAYLSLRAKAPLGKVTRKDLLELAERLCRAIATDAQILPLAKTPAELPPSHSTAWAAIGHPLERVPRVATSSVNDAYEKLMVRINGQWRVPGTYKKE